MIRNYFKIALRTLWKSKGYAAINVFGLSVAFCVCVFLFLTAYRQLTFDDFHEDSERIFQLYFVTNHAEKTDRSTATPLPLVPALRSEFSNELAAETRIWRGTKSLVTYQEKSLDRMVVGVDSGFLNVFTFPLSKGSRQTALRGLNGMVITESMARSVFGDAEPIGKPLQLGSGKDQQTYLVTGICRDIPDNSSIHFDALIRIESTNNYHAFKDKWDAYSGKSYLKLAPSVSEQTFEGQLRQFAKKYYPDNISKLQTQGGKPDDQGDVFAIRLQSMSDVHFGKELSGGKGTPFAVVYAIIGIGLFILLIACINFINLNMARSFTRMREVGVRKSVGATKKQLFVQIWGESILLCFLGFVGGVVLAFQLVSLFNATFGANVNLADIILMQKGFILLMLGIFLLVTFIAGGYPAITMAGYNPVVVLKGKLSLKRPGGLRNSLIVSQFAISCLLICCTVIAVQQLRFLRQLPLGFDKEQVISIPIGNRADGRQVLQRMRNRLADDPSVVSVTGSGINLGKGKDNVSSRVSLGFTYKEKEVSTEWLLVDYDYLKTLGIKLLSGREFDPAFRTDSTNRVIITESMAKKIGETEPVGKYFETDTSGSRYQIIGLVPDFYLYSVTQERMPITMHLSHTEAINYVFVRVSDQSLSSAMGKLEKIWREVAPEAEFMASFLDENIDEWFQNEERLTQIFIMASSITILLSCLGLFAVALLVIEQRTKEIGIRKVMGATVASVVMLLSRDFLKLVLVALLIAVPLAWFGMQQWLNNYTSRVEINAWVFVSVGVAALLIAWLTVGYQSIKAALMNPVKSLRSE
ncbi:ABC transporter permease [Rhabdobacter roseus]|uniref:ABC-type antimicrobial peptide transport system permease subunit n=1 Tax=Rhabdobacter roseus TaxID=1655419 RepID=A0A840TZE5_9BACT|nr:ABC transporter permease [Rhabdobacter roseus]MBB5285558.1 ABC-type antimicrobial peptide transport system permease subunit [Rhabdobacter roseus]